MMGKFTSFNAHRYDEAPTENSDNLLTSGAIYEALQNASGGTVDATPTQDSENAVSSGGVFAALVEKQDTPYCKSDRSFHEWLRPRKYHVQ